MRTRHAPWRPQRLLNSFPLSSQALQALQRLLPSATTQPPTPALLARNEFLLGNHSDGALMHRAR